jgi:putative tryptophan/tyrosine transport system substrate-binding protein
VKRRDFITLLGGAAIGWPLAARAQQPSTQVARIGVLNTGLDDAVSGGLGYRAFVAELQKLGFTEGRNLVIDYGRTDQGADKAFADAATMARSNVAVIVASGSELPLQAAVAASPSVPIVILANNYDPIARGYVTSLARPGGRITGLFNRQPELAQKRVELLTEAFPTRTRLAVLWDASSSEAFAAAEGTAKALSLQFYSTKLQRPPYDFDATFHSMISDNPQMLLVLSSRFFAPHVSRIAELAIRNRLPAMFNFSAYTRAGGLMSYGIDPIPPWRRAASYVVKILRGAKPMDLPVEQATTFELALNLKTAKALGIELPTSILLRADEVIE